MNWTKFVGFIWFLCALKPEKKNSKAFKEKCKRFTVVPVAGDGGMGEEEVVDVGVLLDWRNISSSVWPWGDVAIKVAAKKNK